MKLVIITQTYKDDYEECKLLCESVDKFVPPDIIHYVFVDDIDLKMFSHLKNNRREILPKSLVIPKWLIKYPFKFNGHNLWFSPLTIPVRGWIIQQVVKLGVFEFIDADYFLNLDSEVVFVKPFSRSLVIKDDKLFLHRQTRAWKYHSRGQYIKAASKLCNIPEEDNLWSSWYLSSSFCFSKNNLSKLTKRIQDHSILRNWKIPLFNTTRFSEYMLYGLFVEHVVGIENSGHYYDSEGIVLEQYPSQYRNGLIDIRNNILNISSIDNKVAILVQKSRGFKDKNISLNITNYKKTIYECWDILNR